VAPLVTLFVTELVWLDAVPAHRQSRDAIRSRVTNGALVGFMAAHI